METKRIVGDVAGRFWAKVEKTDACWLWHGAKQSKGYGSFGLDGKTFLAHRLAYEEKFGPIPEDLTIDHLCRNHACVRPDHLEPVTNAENTLRGVGFSAQNARKTHCPQGHPFEGDNVLLTRDGNRKCVACKREESRLYQERKRERRRGSITAVVLLNGSSLELIGPADTVDLARALLSGVCAQPASTVAP